MVEQTRKNKAQDIYPLSPLQEGMLFHHLYHRDAGDHITQGVLPIAGTVDAGLLEQAFQKLVDRHDVMRTVFLHDDLKKPRQVVVETRSARVRFIDLENIDPGNIDPGNIDPGNIDTTANSIAEDDLAQGFDLKKDLLVRMTLVKLRTDDYKLIITNHHIILDGWSLGVLLEELIEYYWAAKTGNALALGSAIQFKHYIKWVGNSDPDSGYQYFSNALEDFGSPACIPRQDWYGERQDIQAAAQSHSGFDFNFGREKTAELEHFCRAQQITLNTAVQGLWALVLQCFSHRDDIVFGNVVSGRSPEIRGIEKMVGMTINTLPLRVRLTDDMPFASLLKGIQNQSKMLEKYSYLQLAEIQKRVRNNELLFDHTLAFENYPITEELFSGKYADIGFSIPFRQGRDFTSYDLDVTFFPGTSLVVNFWYNTAAYSAATIESLAHTFDYLLEQLLCKPELSCGEFSWVPQRDNQAANKPYLTGVNPALETWVNDTLKAAANTNVLVRDAQGRTVPEGASGFLYIAQGKKTENHQVLLVEAVRFPGNSVRVIAHHARRIHKNKLVFSPEVIESFVLADTAIVNCAFVATEDSSQAVLWLQTQTETDALAEKAIETLKYRLASHFPRYMLPACYKRAQEIVVQADSVYVKPAPIAKPASAQRNLSSADDVEMQLATLWKDILEVDSVLPDDDFFLQGGHSLTALRFISRAKKLFKCPPTTLDLFSIRTFSGMVDKIRSDESASRTDNGTDHLDIASTQAIEPAQNKSWYGTSSQQQRLYSLQTLDPASLAYNMPDAFILRGRIDVERLSKAFELTIAKHESLRTSFHLQHDEIVQKVHAKSSFRLSVATLEQDTAVAALLDAFIQPFRLDVPQLVRACLHIQNETQAILLIDMHHIVTDGVSIDLLVKDLVQAYHEQVLQPARLQYKDYCEWQRLPQVRELMAKQKQYWLQVFNGEIPVLALPTDQARKPEFRYAAEQFRFELGGARSKQIQDCCQQHRVTPYMFFMAAYFVVLARYTNQQDIVIGTPVAGRTHQELEDTVGMFVNTLAVKQSLDFSAPFTTLLSRLRETLLGAFENQNFPLEELITALNPPRDLSRNALFDVLFVLEDKKQPLPQFADLEFELVEHANKMAKFDLLLAVLDDPENYAVHMEYAAGLFAEKTIVRLADHFLAVVDAVLADSACKPGEIEILSATEIAQLLDGFNPSSSPLGENESIAAAFEKTALTHANQPAVNFQGETLTFAELNARANRIAHALQANGIKTGDCIALMMTKSLDMIVAIYGVLKAGAAYVPIGADYPRARIESILQDLQARLLVYNNKLNETISALDPDRTLECTLVCFDALLEQTERSPRAITNPGIAIAGNDLAYVIYTSGSTGKPKGIMIEQRSILNLALYFKNIFGPGDQVTQFAPFTFDASAGEILTTLLNGACLHVLPNELIGDPAKYADYLIENDISFTALPPPYLVNVDFSKARKLHTLLAAGSSSNAEVIETLRKQLTYINAYGPTETTVISTEWRSDRDPLLKNCIGRPIVNTTVYILSDHNKLQPTGIEGEICIGGLGVARGYVGDAEKTASQFIANPYRQNEIIYRTGDLGKLTAQGDIIFLGRKDDQVKIRGFRIEIAEVEHHVKSLPIIDDAHVMAFEDVSGNLALCCYFTSSKLTHKQADLEALRRELRSCMPEYMIPAWLVCMEALPLTNNGKVDRKQLPPPEESGPLQEIVAPRTEMESLLLETWQAVLGNRNIGITDNFFALGGDSIKAIQIAARLNTLGFKLETGRIFQHPRIQDLAPFVQKNTLTAEQGAVSGLQALTPIQHWFFQKNFSEAHHWNQATVLYSTRGFDAKRVRAALNMLLVHHDNLRAVPGGDNMFVASELAYTNEIPLVQAASSSIETTLANFGNTIQASIDLDNGPLMRAGIVTTPVGDYLLIAIHHLLVDGVSWRILYDDFCSVYQALEESRQAVLPPKTHSFKQWAEGLLAYARSSGLRKQYRYWSTVCRSDALLQFVSAQTGATPTLAEAQSIDLHFDEDTTRDFQEQAHRAFNTNANDLLLAALANAMASVFGRGDFLLNLEGHGREDVCPGLDISRTVGWFTSAWPVRLTANTVVANNREAMDKLIISTKETLHSIPDNGLGYGALRFISSNDHNDFDLAALSCEPHISFNFLGDFSFDNDEGAIQISGLNAGAEMSPKGEALCALNINGSVFQGKLGFNFEYLPALLSTESVKALASEFQHQLVEIITYCCSQKQVRYSPSDFSADALQLKDLEVINPTHALESIEDIHNLTPLQEGMLYTCLLNLGRGDYNIQNDIVLRGDLDHLKLEAAFKQLSTRHQALRTAIVHENLSQPLQVILKKRDLPFCYFNISDLDAQAQQKYIDELQREDWLRGFDLARDCLTRVVLLQTAAQEHRMLMLSHHIMMDGWCVGAVFGELLEIYRALCEGTSARLETAADYSAYLDWLQKQDKDVSRNYWKQSLSDFEHHGGLPFISVGTHSEYCLRDDSFILSPGKTAKLHSLAAENGLTLNTLAQTIWALLLAAYSNTDDVVFANVISGRPAELLNADKTIGLFVNTIPLRVRLNQSQSFLDLASSIQAAFKDAEANGYLGLAEIREQANLPTTVFDHVFVFENFPVGQFESESPVPGLTIEAGAGKEQVNYDFNIILAPGDEFSIRFSHNEHAVSAQQVERIKTHFALAIDQLLENINSPCCAFSLLEEEDLAAWKKLNDTQVAYNLEQSLVDIISRQVQQSPDANAVIFQDVNVTYAQLWHAAGVLATRLQKEYGVQPGKVVALALKRSQHMMTGVMGILRAGCAWLPIDPDLPAERIAYMLENANCEVLLTDQRKLLPAALQQNAINIVEIGETARVSTTDADLPTVSSNDLAYVLYTSGSTGRPKGVMVEHRSIVNRLLWMIEEFDFSSRDVFLQKTAFTFDVSVFELIVPFMCGASLVLLRPGEERLPEVIAATIRKENVSVIHFVPSMLSGFLDAFAGEIPLASLRHCVCSGEALTLSHKERFYKQIPHTLLSNLYGPTEAAIDVTCQKVERDRTSVSIGTPVANTRCYVLDALGRVCPQGVIGELHLAGVQLARGYINNRTLTVERFIQHSLLNERLYRTGDLAMLAEDGSIHYLGRTDFQVKVRGFRIELGEIENTFLAQEIIKDVLVTAIKLADETTALCAYFTAQEQMSEDNIRHFLKQSLPEYMIPAFIVQLQSFPLNTSGKIDRKLLPNPVERAGEVQHQRAFTELELFIERIWRQVLLANAETQNELLPLNSRFEQLGGHSINAIRVCALISRETGVALSVADLYRHPSIQQLAVHVENVKRQQTASTQHVASQSFAHIDEALSEQILDKAFADWTHFEQALLAQITTNKSRTFYFSPIQALHIKQLNRLSGGALQFEYCPDSAVLKEVIADFISTQPLLLAHYEKTDGSCAWQWRYNEHTELAAIPFIDLSAYESDAAQQLIEKLITRTAEKLQERFSKPVAQELAYCLYLVKLANGCHQLLFGADHLITDGSSLEIMRSEIASRYLNKIQGTANSRATDKSYESYTTLVRSGPQVAAGNYRELLAAFCEQQTQWLNFYDKHHVKETRRITFSTQIHPELQSPIEAALATFIEFVWALTDFNKIPLTFVADQRKHIDSGYFQVIGEFLDHVPALYSGDANVKQWLRDTREFIANATKDNVNFLALAENPAAFGEWLGLADMLYKNDAQLKLIRFNYQGEETGDVNSDHSVTEQNDGFALRGILCDVSSRGDRLYFSIETNIAVSTDFLENFIDYQQYESLTNQTG